MGTIIPYASGGTISLDTPFDTSLGAQAAIGFGNNAAVTVSGGVINLTSTVDNMAFSMPRDGKITSIAAYFSVSDTAALNGDTVTIIAQLYSSPTPNDVFTAIPGAAVTLSPSFTSAVAVGAIASGLTTGLYLPVTAGTRLLLVFTAIASSGAVQQYTVVGHASAGVGIL